MKAKAVIGTVLGIIAMIMAWYYYDWKLVAIISLSLWGNNMERSK